MDQLETAEVSGVQRLQQIERFWRLHFADEDAIRPMPQGRTKQVRDGDGRRVALPGRVPPVHAWLRAGTTFGLLRWISAVSSIRTMRSCSGMCAASVEQRGLYRCPCRRRSGRSVRSRSALVSSLAVSRSANQPRQGRPGCSDE